MKAILYTDYGPADVLHPEEVEKPSPQDKQILIKVQATSINAGDWGGMGNPILARVIGGGILKPKNTRPGSDVVGGWKRL
jgi:NADPH:quinone reductase-like Zn-dependent oxidoreductase